jgi:hypothetical protein
MMSAGNGGVLLLVTKTGGVLLLVTKTGGAPPAGMGAAAGAGCNALLETAPSNARHASYAWKGKAPAGMGAGSGDASLGTTAPPNEPRV